MSSGSSGSDGEEGKGRWTQAAKGEVRVSWVNKGNKEK